VSEVTRVTRGLAARPHTVASKHRTIFAANTTGSGPTDMTSLAAYYVFVATTASRQASEEAARRDPRPSFFERLRFAVAGFVTSRSQAPRPA
jgi:hypothetical protein